MIIDKHGRAERKIQRETDCNSILSVLVRYGRSDEGLRWSRTALREELRLDSYRFYSALTVLEKNQSIDVSRGEIIITDEGRDYYLQACRRSSIAIGSATIEWKDEVLTGSREENGSLEPTEIENAVLPRARSEMRSCNSEDLFDSVIDEKFYLASLLKIDIDELEKHLRDGRVRSCKGYDGNNHIGIFDRNGEYWQALCRKCTIVRRHYDGK
jgi:hypothetical protein